MEMKKVLQQEGRDAKNVMIYHLSNSEDFHQSNDTLIKCFY